MNKWGIMVDVSHPSKGAMMQAIGLSKAPVIASHSAVRKLANHSRNLDDEMLMAIKTNGGVAQIVAFASYVKTDPAERGPAIAALRQEFVAAERGGAAARAARPRPRRRGPCPVGGRAGGSGRGGRGGRGGAAPPASRRSRRIGAQSSIGAWRTSIESGRRRRAPP